MSIIEGLRIFDGIAYGKAFIIPDGVKSEIPRYAVTEGEAEAGWKRFLAAADAVRERTESRIAGSDGEGRRIFEAHIMMLRDTVFFEEIRAAAADSRLNIESVLDAHIKNEAEKLRASGNEMLAERADDILDVFGGVLKEMTGEKSPDLPPVPENAVVVAKKLSPSDALALFKSRPSGLCLSEGGASGHLAILSRAARIPAVFSAKDAHVVARAGDDVIVAGGEGKVFVNPDEKTALAFSRNLGKIEIPGRAVFSDTPCATGDGKRIALFANIGMPEEAKTALENGAEGIGLFRTEFLFMQSDARNGISEDAQYEAYKTALEIMDGRPVVIRTLDAGGDKLVDSLGRADTSANPLLGLRSVRFTLANPDIFLTQFRALLRASVHGNLKIMLPLVTCIDEVRESRKLLARAKKELRERHIPFDKNVPLGIMVETPACALSSDVFAHHSDFFSIGTNDLTQYSLAVDRENPDVSRLFSEFHLAVARMIKLTSDNARKAGIPVSACGEMAGTEEGALLLFALGVETLSVSPSSIEKIKRAFSRFTKKELRMTAKEILFAPETSDIRGYLGKLLRRRVKG
jgi:phosphotransferase system enzyme I (PtsI)